jgi:hypothetical protein
LSLKWLSKVTLIIYNQPKNEYIEINTSQACHKNNFTPLTEEKVTQIQGCNIGSYFLGTRY